MVTIGNNVMIDGGIDIVHSVKRVDNKVIVNGTEEWSALKILATIDDMGFTLQRPYAEDPHYTHKDYNTLKIFHEDALTYSFVVTGEYSIPNLLHTHELQQFMHYEYKRYPVIHSAIIEQVIKEIQGVEDPAIMANSSTLDKVEYHHAYIETQAGKAPTCYIPLEYLKDNEFVIVSQNKMK
jgi:hypothetical protein